MVAKLFKPGAAMTAEMVEAQFASLAGLHATLDASKFNGWTISVPHPLFTCPSPLALMMTVAPGKPLEA